MSEKLSLEEIKNLSDEEVGQELIDLCKFPIDEITPIPDLYQIGFNRYYPHQICADLNAIAEVAKIVIEKIGEENFGLWILHYLEEGALTTPIWSDRRNRNEWICAINRMSTRQRAEACLLALQENL